LQELPKRGYRLRVLLRRAETLPQGCAGAVIGDLARPYNMTEALAGVDAIIHTAGLAGTMSGVPEDDYRLFNTEATVGFAKAAQRAKIKRFVFLSSIRAQSGPTAEGILTEDREPRPTDAYGRSKLAAEQGLAAIGLDWVALRLALVYGPGVEGNMAKLIRLARSPYPLPLAGLKGEHSLLGLDNLVEAVDTVLATEAPLRRPLIVADPTPLTIGTMIAAMRRGLGRRPALLYVPEPLMKGALHVSGRFELEPLFGSLLPIPALARLIGRRESRPRRDLLRCFATALHLDAATQQKTTPSFCIAHSPSYLRRILLVGLLWLTWGSPFGTALRT
jgi:UDP-glucose 4-epimerase